MRRFLLSTTALILLSAPVLADPPDRGEGHDQGRGQGEVSRQAPPEHGGNFDRGDHNRGPAPQATIQAPPQHVDHGGRPQAVVQAPQNRDQRGDHGDWRGERRPLASNQAPQPQFNRTDRGRDDRHAFNDIRPDNRPEGNRPESRPDNRQNRDFNRDGHTDYRGQRFNGPRHDFSGFRDFHRDFQASRHFRGPDYRRPAGWYPHHWAFGEFLPTAFWVRDYWLIDFVDYDLPPPPYGAVWVRVDRDALLIDEDSGEIITVEYDVFY